MVKMIAVDDSRTDLERIKRIVEETYGSSKPYKLKLFTNAREVNESEEKWDIAILDIMMPGITGMELLYKLRRNNPKTKFIYVTGYDAVVEKAIHSHPFDLVKKRTLEELKQALTDCWVELEKEKQTLVLQGEKEMSRYIGIYRREDIARLREQLRIGDPVKTEVWFDRLGERLLIPRQRVRKIIGIYPHLVELEAWPGEPVQTVTYAELLLNGGTVERTPGWSKGKKRRRT